MIHYQGYRASGHARQQTECMKITLAMLLLFCTLNVFAEDYCADGLPQPTHREETYAARVHTILLEKGINNDAHYLCGEKNVLFIGNRLMSEALASNSAAHIGLATAKASGYTLVVFSDEGGVAHDLPEVWGYDLLHKKVMHGVQNYDGRGNPSEGFKWE